MLNCVEGTHIKICRTNEEIFFIFLHSFVLIENIIEVTSKENNNGILGVRRALKSSWHRDWIICSNITIITIYIIHLYCHAVKGWSERNVKLVSRDSSILTWSGIVFFSFHFRFRCLNFISPYLPKIRYLLTMRYYCWITWIYWLLLCSQNLCCVFWKFFLLKLLPTVEPMNSHITICRRLAHVLNINYAKFSDK